MMKEPWRVEKRYYFTMIYVQHRAAKISARGLIKLKESFVINSVRHSFRFFREINRNAEKHKELFAIPLISMTKGYR